MEALNRHSQSHEIHLQLSILEDSINQDRQEETAFRLGKASRFRSRQHSAWHFQDATHYERQYVERTQRLTCELEKLYRCVVWDETSKELKRPKKQAVPFALMGDLQAQCRTIEHVTAILLNSLGTKSTELSDAKRILNALLKRWATRAQYYHTLRVTPTPDSQWPAPIYLLQNPAALTSQQNSGDPYSQVEEEARPVWPWGLTGMVTGLASAFLTLANPILWGESIFQMPLVGLIAEALSALSSSLWLGLELGTGLIALGCLLFVALKGAPGRVIKQVGWDCYSPPWPFVPWWSLMSCGPFRYYLMWA